MQIQDAFPGPNMHHLITERASIQTGYFFPRRNWNGRGYWPATSSTRNSSARQCVYAFLPTLTSVVVVNRLYAMGRIPADIEHPEQKSVPTTAIKMILYDDWTLAHPQALTQYHLHWKQHDEAYRQSGQHQTNDRGRGKSLHRIPRWAPRREPGSTHPTRSHFTSGRTTSGSEADHRFPSPTSSNIPDGTCGGMTPAIAWILLW